MRSTQPFMRTSPLFLSLFLLASPTVEATCSSWSNRFQQEIEGTCVCNVTSCDEITDEYQTLADDTVGVFQTSQAGDRLAYSTLPSEELTSDENADLVIDTTKTYQEIIGFGGAFTDASSINVYKMNEQLQQLIVDAYYGVNGLQYTLGRIPIASTDFSEYIYSYNDVVDDFEMEHFSIDVDKSSNTSKISFIHRALNTTERNVTLFASSWAPPAWMTTENTTLNCELQGSPGGEYWQALALYYSKFLSAYEAEGIKIWGLTTQNEPVKQPITLNEWQSLRFDAETERDFLKKDLGPMLATNHPDVKIMILDDQKDNILSWNASLVDEEALQYVSGVGVHWYKDLDFILDTYGNFADLATFHEAYPDLFILPTEACAGYLLAGIGTGAGTAVLQYNVTWWRAEIYARDIINDLANFAAGWTDWNLVLDTNGGPNWAQNFVDAPILIDEEGLQEFYKQPMYYIMGHFSKFITPGSVRVALNVSDAAESDLENVDKVAFVTPEGLLAIVLSNRDAAEKSIKISLPAQQRQIAITLPANAVQTVLFGVDGVISSSSGDGDDAAGSSSSVASAETSGIGSYALAIVMCMVIGMRSFL